MDGTLTAPRTHRLLLSDPVLVEDGPTRPSAKFGDGTYMSWRQELVLLMRATILGGSAAATEGVSPQ